MRERWVEHLVRMQEKNIFCRVVVGKPTEGPRYRWEDNIKMDLEEIGWEVVDWICLL
jgi:hypothetical protein